MKSKLILFLGIIAAITAAFFIEASVREFSYQKKLSTLQAYIKDLDLASQKLTIVSIASKRDNIQITDQEELSEFKTSLQDLVYVKHPVRKELYSFLIFLSALKTDNEREFTLSFYCQTNSQAADEVLLQFYGYDFIEKDVYASFKSKMLFNWMQKKALL